MAKVAGTTLKAECIDRQSFATHQQAKTVIFEYMQVFYVRIADLV